MFQNYPGKFLLSYLPRIRCRHEYVSVSPDGFKFRGQMFSRVNDLFRWFKEHFRDPIPGQSTPGTPHGALTSRTPYHATPGAVTGTLLFTSYYYLYKNIHFIIKHFIYIYIYVMFQE